jgi:hypothetical protein
LLTVWKTCDAVGLGAAHGSPSDLLALVHLDDVRHLVFGKELLAFESVEVEIVEGVDPDFGVVDLRLQFFVAIVELLKLFVFVQQPFHYILLKLEHGSSSKAAVPIS